ncbi:MAG: polysaccharide deacetylase family protein [Firmicutes bacterium]|nr:polysaccharide deacetylase family protein [Bacillota bacterium]
MPGGVTWKTGVEGRMDSMEPDPKLAPFIKPNVLQEQQYRVDGITTISRVPTTDKVVALTFDDGPYRPYTRDKLAILARYGLRATFFWVGTQIKAVPEQAEAVVAAGHEVGNHTNTHPYLTRISSDRIRSEIQTCKSLISDQGAPFIPLFRPPYGFYNSVVMSVAQNLGYLWNVLWTIDTLDYTSPGVSRIVQKVLQGLQPGAIVLMHDWPSQTVSALPAIIEGILERGYRIEPLGSLLGPVIPYCRHLWVASPYLRGEDVVSVQQALLKRGFDPGAVDGVYGPRTAGAVRLFQQQEGLHPDGVVDHEEYQALNVECPAGQPPPYPIYRPDQCRQLQVTSPYMRGEDVAAVQNALGDRGINPGPVDGIYGPQSASGVRAFQQREGLEQDGIFKLDMYPLLMINCPGG